MDKERKITGKKNFLPNFWWSRQVIKWLDKRYYGGILKKIGRVTR